jgi:uncharacterized protein YkwD/preprotein translocase subunit YajC
MVIDTSFGAATMTFEGINVKYVKGISIFLIVVALVAAMAGCTSSPSQHGLSTPAHYYLTICGGEGGEVTSLGEGTFTCDEDEVVDLAAAPASGYRFLNWTGDVDTIENIEAALTTITVNGDCSITANFEAVLTEQCSLTVSSSDGGSVTTPGEGTFTYDAGAVVSVVADPATGYQFVNWIGDVDTVADSNAASTNITVNGDYSVTANFEVIAPVQYSLTVSSNAGGSVTTPGEGTFNYDAGTVVSLVAAPATGYQFINWTGHVDTVDDVAVASTTVTMSENCSVTANFEAILTVRYDLTVTSGSGGWVTSPGTGIFSYDAGTVVSLVASPTCIYQYQFVNWTGDVVTIANTNAASTTITMNGDYSIRANFEAVPPSQYGLTIASTAGGSVITPGEGTFVGNAGLVVGLVATPAAGYQFVNWTGNAETIANVNAASTTIILYGDYSIRANFEASPPSQYSLTISSAAGGSVTTPGEGTFTRDAGTVVNLVATAGTGYQFVNWTGNVGTVANVNSASTTITINDDYSITANFETIRTGQHDLTTSSTAGGSVTTPGEGTFTRDAGTVVSLVATPTAGYHFVNWTGNVGTVANVNSASTTITIDDDYSITANFETIPTGQNNLTTSSTAGGSVTTPGEGTFARDAGTVVSLVATAASGCHFVNWTGDVGTVANVNAASTAITMNDSYSLTAVFAEDSPSPPGIDYTEAQAEALIAVLVNAERQQSGLSALSQDSLLASLAKEHSISMVENNFFSHTRYPGERSFDYGMLPGEIRGENIAMIPTRQHIPGPYLSLQEVCAWAVSAWMNSSGHRANILKSCFTRTGVGVAFSEGGDYLYITQMFEGLY